MNTFKRHLKILFVAFKLRLVHETEYRVNLVMGFVGSFVFIFLNFFIIYYFVKKFSFPGWGANEMWVLLGSFMVTWYGVFYIYHRGVLNLITNIRSGKLDLFLLKPVDSQFSTLLYGGGTNNLVAILFGLILFTKSSLVFIQPYFIFRYVFSILLSLLGTYDFFCLTLLLVSLNFRFGYIEEIVGFAYSLQSMSRFPLVAFTYLPLLMLIFVIPLSAITTIPALVIVTPVFPVNEVVAFVVFSALFTYLSRQIFLRAIRSYSSGS